MSEQIRIKDVRPGDTITVRLGAFPEASTLQVVQVAPGGSDSTVLISFSDGSSVEFSRDSVATRE